MKKKRIPLGSRKGGNLVTLLRLDDGAVIASTGEVAVRFKDGLEKKDLPDNSYSQDIVELEKEDSIWTSVKEKMEQMMGKQAACSVVIPVNRLLTVLNAVDEPYIRLDWLPDFLDHDDQVTHLVDGTKYLQSIRTVSKLDAVRVVEVAPAVSNEERMSTLDSACALGALNVKHVHFIDEGRKKASRESRIAALKKRAAKNGKGKEGGEEQPAVLPKRGSAGKDSGKKASKRRKR